MFDIFSIGAFLVGKACVLKGACSTICPAIRFGITTESVNGKSQVISLRSSANVGII